MKSSPLDYKCFWTSLSEGIKAIAGLIPITLHLCKLNGRYHLCYASISPLYAINSLLNSQYAKNHIPYRAVTSNLTMKQQANLKIPIKDINKHLNRVRNCFNPLHSLFYPGSRIVNHFSMSQTSFGHISINSLMILMVSNATESPWKDLLIDASHVSRQSILAKILSRSTGNYHVTVY